MAKDKIIMQTKNGDLHDNIVASGVLDISGLSKKQIKELAKRAAGWSGENGSFTWNDVAEGRADVQGTYTRHEDLFKRKFNQQLNKNLKETKKKQLIEDAKNGDVTALGKYQAMGTEDVAKVLAPIVTLPAAAGTGVLSTLLGGAKAIYANPLLRTTLDLAGTYDGVKNAMSDNGIKKTIRLANEGDTWGAIKSGVGDLIDIASPIDLLHNPYLRSATKQLANDTVESYKALKSGAEPVLGIAPWSGLQYSSLPARTRAELTHGRGLGSYDIQNLLDRGFTPEQIAHLTDTRTPGVTSNPRANILAQRLQQMGIVPSEMSRRQYLEQALMDGEELVVDTYHRPMTFAEGMREGIPVRPSNWSWVDTYYPNLATGTPTVYNNYKYSDLMDKLSTAVGVIDPSISASIRPKIQQLLEQGAASNLDPKEMETQLVELFKSYDKPFITGKTTVYAPVDGVPYDPNIHWDQNTSHVTSEVSKIDDLERYLKYGDQNQTSQIRLTPYDKDTVSYDFNPGDDQYSPNHFWLFNINSPDKKTWLQNIWDSTHHGGVSTERSKSLQSNFVANAGYKQRALDGEGVIVFANDGNGNYIMDDTNEAAATLWSPGTVGSGTGEHIVADSAEKLMRANMLGWNGLLSQVNPRAFIKGQLPTLTATFRYPNGDPKKIALPVQMIDGQYKIDASKLHELAKQYDVELNTARQTRINNAKKNIDDILGESGALDLPDGRVITIDPNSNKIVVLAAGQEPIDLEDFSLSGLPNDLMNKIARLGRELENTTRPQLHGYGITINQPRVGFRKFNNGGIMHNLNQHHRKLLGVY